MRSRDLYLEVLIKNFRKNLFRFGYDSLFVFFIMSMYYILKIEKVYNKCYIKLGGG